MTLEGCGLVLGNSFRFLRLLSVFFALGACSSSPASENPDPGNIDPGSTKDLNIGVDKTQPDVSALNVEPLLEIPIVDLSGEITAMPSAFSDPAYQLGDVTCDEPCAFPFGAPLPEGIDNIGFEYVVKKGTEIRAASPGFVHFMRQNNNTEDFEVHVKLVEFGAYRLIYDHIQPDVQEGDVIEVGQILGTAGPWGPNHGRIELQINYEDPVTFETWAVCPANFGTDTFVALHQKWLDMHNQTAVTSTHPHFQTYDSLCMAEKRFP